MKTKILILFLAVTPVMVQAQVNYAISGNTAYVTNSPSASGDIVITNIYNGYPVTQIGTSAFQNCTNLTSVAIPTNVTSIGTSAFSGSGLTSVTITNSVASIGDFAFARCSGLTSVTIPNSITSIGSGVFFQCFGLTNFTVDAANPAYSSVNGVLFDETQTTLIQFPIGLGGSYAISNSVTSIGENAFRYCTNLTSVTIGNSVTSIGHFAFGNCSGLTSVTIPNSVTSIGMLAVAACSGLTNVTIGNSVISIGDEAFDDCPNLTSVTIGTNVISIGNEAFGYCSSLTSVTIPNSVTSIGDNAFYYCTSLTIVTIGSGVTSIGDDAFYQCTSLTSAIFQGNAPPDDGTVFSGYHFNGPATVYYYYGMSGWGSTYGGLPTVMLGAPAPQVGSGSIGVQAGIFGFTITGVTNQTVIVEASTNLMNWQPVWTNMLTGTSTNFTDAQWRTYPSRFYRVSSP